MKEYYYNGVQVSCFSEPKDNGSFRDGQFWVKVFPNEEAFTRELTILNQIQTLAGVVKVESTGMLVIIGEGGKMSYPAIREYYVGERNIRSYSKRYYLEKDLINIFSKLAHILSDIESKGVIHNDIKPKNILISDEDNSPCLIDFNISKAANEPITAIHTHATPKFSAPEKNRGEVSIRGDIYSFGCVLNSCMWQNPEGHNAYSRELINIREICLKEDPDQRYASFTEVEAALLALTRVEEKSLVGSMLKQSPKKTYLDFIGILLRHLPLITVFLYCSGICLILLSIFLIAKGPHMPDDYVPSLKEDIGRVIYYFNKREIDIKNE